ncbi:MAG: hypothetical protein JW856_03870 [Dehalococcoidales bacterium]|nr:hypothetical protein [Dehalococcoidales bacterium]
MNTKRLSVVLVILLVIGLVYFGVGYFREHQQEAELATQMDDISKLLALIPRPPADLQQRLADAQQANATAKQNLLPSDVDTTLIIKNVFQLADEFNIKVIPLVTDQWTMRTVGEESYRVLTVSLSIEADFADLLDFVNRLYDSEFSIVAIDRLAIDEVVNGAAISGRIELAIYTLPVSSE